MEKMFYHEAMRYLAAVLFVIFNSVAVSAQRFETHQAYFSGYQKLTRTIKIKSTSKFAIKKDKRITWVDCETDDSSVIIKASINTSNEKRSCLVFLMDDTGNPVDTLEVIQYGKQSNTAVNSVSKAVSTTKAHSNTRSSSSAKGTYGQCAARTQKGTRCLRQASAGSIYCWQHNK